MQQPLEECSHFIFPCFTSPLWSGSGRFSNNWPDVGRCSRRAQITAVSKTLTISRSRTLIVLCPPVSQSPPQPQPGNYSRLMQIQHRWRTPILPLCPIFILISLFFFFVFLFFTKFCFCKGHLPWLHSLYTPSLSPSKIKLGSKNTVAVWAELRCVE